MSQIIAEGQKYRFLDNGFLCQDWSGLVPYQDVLCATVVPGSGFFEVTFQTPKGKKRRTTILLEQAGQEEAIRALLAAKVPCSKTQTRAQTLKEACGHWMMLGVWLDVLVGVIILMNIVNPDTVTAPIWIMPFLLIGSFLSTGQLLAIGAVILAVCAAKAAASARKRKTVWEVKAFDAGV